MEIFINYQLVSKNKNLLINIMEIKENNQEVIKNTDLKDNHSHLVHRIYATIYMRKLKNANKKYKNRQIKSMEIKIIGELFKILIA